MGGIICSEKEIFSTKDTMTPRKHFCHTIKKPSKMLKPFSFFQMSEKLQEILFVVRCLHAMNRVLHSAEYVKSTNFPRLRQVVCSARVAPRLVSFSL